MCKSMMANPEYSEIFQEKLKDLNKYVEVSRKTLKMLHGIQNKLIKFSPIFRYKTLEEQFQKKDIFDKFFKLKEDFRYIIDIIQTKNMAFFAIFVDEKSEFDTQTIELKRKFQDITILTDYVYTNLTILFKVIRTKCPRLYFISEDQILVLCSLMKFPQSLFKFMNSMFKGVKEICLTDFKDQENIEELKIEGLINYQNEKIYYAEYLIINCKEDAEEIPLISMIQGLEKYNQKYIRDNFKKHLYIIADKFGYDYNGILLYAKENNIIQQSLFLMLDVILDNDLTMLYTCNTLKGDSKSTLNA